METLTITNTLTRKKEPFVSQKPGKVALYVCGITPYDFAHLGHGRVYITFDLLYRLLTFLGYDVTYCRNFTDIDDKLLARAEQQYGDRCAYKKVADTYINAFKEDMRVLNCNEPTYEPRVTEHIPEIITFIQKLLDAGKAYEVDGNVYFSIASFSAYGKLSGQSLEDVRAGERVEVNEQKRDPLDFALWKAEQAGTFWKSPWGYGRPGWHIECSVLAGRYLGETLDIHAGGMDLIFPHHENEIAQSEGVHEKPFARYWMHNAFVQVAKEKMSKSLGNFFTLRQIFEDVDPMVVRYYILTHHYRVPLDFSLEGIKSAKKSYQRLVRLFQDSACSEQLSPEQIKQSPVVQKMLSFLLDDLNTPGMFGVLFEQRHVVQASSQDRCAVKAFLQQVVGLTLEPLPEKAVAITPEIQKLIDEREQARSKKDWVRADALRDQLQALGVDVRDKRLDR